MTDPKLQIIPTPTDKEEVSVSISKPGEFSLDKFKSKHAGAIANIETLQTALPHHSISQANTPVYCV
jgi:hypothetical protein